jgi:hypothetical protein
MRILPWLKRQRRPDDRELDDEIRAHMAISVKERIDAGEDPESARLAALREFGYVPAIRESMRQVWYSRWLAAAAALERDMRIALRSLRRAKGLAATVVVTLALGIGANAAIFSVVRGVLMRPLVNRDEDRLLYIRQSAPGIGAENTKFSVPEVKDLKARVTTISAFGDFSTVDFTLVGLGSEPRIVKAGVVSGSYFDVMGLRPVLGRLLNANDDGPKAAGAAVLTYRFWTVSLNSDPAVVGKVIRLGPRAATVVGVLEPSVPYPADTEIIANVVTSPHHLGAMMEMGRTHRMTELFGRLAPGASIESARAELIAVHAAMMREHPEAYTPEADIQLSVKKLRDQIAAPARTILLLLLAAAAVVFVIACSNVANLILARSVRREGELAVRAALGAGPGALRRTLLAESLVCAAPAPCSAWSSPALFSAWCCGAPRSRARRHRRFSMLWSADRSRAAGVCVRDCLQACTSAPSGLRSRRSPRAAPAVLAANGSLRITRAPTGAFESSRRPRLPSRSCCSPARACCSPRSSRCRRRTPATTCGTCWCSTSRRRRRVPTSAKRRSSTSIRRRCGASVSCRPWKALPSGCSCPGAMPGAWVPACPSRLKAIRRRTAKKIRAPGSASCRPASSPSSASRSSPAATSQRRTVPAASES